MLNVIKTEFKEFLRDLLKDSLIDYLKYRKRRIKKVGEKKFKREIRVRCFLHFLSAALCLGSIYFLFCLAYCFK